MVHHSQIDDDVIISRDDEDSTKMQALEYFAGAPGTSVFVKVTNVEQRGEGERERDFDGQYSSNYKISCSMKVVSQKNGEDLDPQGLKTSHTIASRGGGGGGDGGGHGELLEMGSI